MTGPAWTWSRGDDPLLGTAIHAGHDLREEVAALTALDDAARLREEDPFTDRWARLAGNSVVFHRSRWEVDVNRSRDRAVYLQPEDCWGLQPWRRHPPAGLVERSVELYDAFYDDLLEVCRDMERRHGCFVLLDLHTYNHRRLGPDAPPADPAANPELNLGTSTIDPTRWGGLVDRFLGDLNAQGVDARENVRFRGAELAAWIHRNFPATGCCLAIDVKKVFVDEHSGEFDDEEFDRLTAALTATLPGLREAVARN